MMTQGVKDQNELDYLNEIAERVLVAAIGRDGLFGLIPKEFAQHCQHYGDEQFCGANLSHGWWFALPNLRKRLDRRESVPTGM